MRVMETSLIPTLEKHVQELEGKIENQKKEIVTLKKLIDHLQKALEKKSD